MSETVLFYEKETDEINDLYSILSTNFSLDLKKSDIGEFQKSNDFVEKLNLIVFCLTNQFIKSENCMRVFETCQKKKKSFLVVKLEEIIVKSVKLGAILFDDKRCFDFSKDKEKRTSILYHSRFQDFLKAINSQVGKEIGLKYKDCKSIYPVNISLSSSSNKTSKIEVNMDSVKKSIKNLVDSIDQILEKVSMLNIQSPILDKVINFIKNFLVKYLLNTDANSSNSIDLAELEFFGSESNLGLVTKLEKLEIELKNLAEQLLDSQNQNSNLIEKLKELEIHNSDLKAKLELMESSLRLEPSQYSIFNEEHKNEIYINRSIIESELSTEEQSRSIESSCNSKESVVTTRERIVEEDENIEKEKEDYVIHESESSNYNKQADNESYGTTSENIMIEGDELPAGEIVYQLNESVSNNNNNNNQLEVSSCQTLNHRLSSMSFKSNASYTSKCNKQAILTKTYDLDFGEVSRMASNSDGTEVFVVDHKTNEIKVIEVNGTKILRKLSPEALNNPLNILITDSNRILVTNYSNSSILVFDKEFNLKNEFENVIEKDNIIDFIEIDELNRIYMVHNYFNKVTVYEFKNFEKISEFKATTPWNIKIKNDKLFLISLTYWEWTNKSERTLKRISKGENCINIIDKFTFEIKESINVDGWLRPDGLCFDKDDNLITTAFLIDKDNSIVSDFRFLFILNQNFDLMREFYLDQIYYITDFLVVHNKLIFCGGGENEKQWVKVFEVK